MQTPWFSFDEGAVGKGSIALRMYVRTRLLTFGLEVGDELLAQRLAEAIGAVDDGDSLVGSHSGVKYCRARSSELASSDYEGCLRSDCLVS